MVEELTVYVPAPGTRLREEIIWDGSGVVGSEVGGSGRLRIDYEGDDDLFPTFGTRVRRAAERHTWEGPDGKSGYPTSACAYVSPEEVIAVGSYRPEEGQLDVTDRAAVEEWLGLDQLSDEDLMGG